MKRENQYDWWVREKLTSRTFKITLIFAGIILCCSAFGACIALLEFSKIMGQFL